MYTDIEVPAELKVFGAGTKAIVSLQTPIKEDPFLDNSELENKKKGVMINPAYLYMNVGEEICAYYRGIVMINLKNRQTGKMEAERAVLLQSDKGTFVCSSYMLVELFQKECTSGEAYFIVYTGEKTTSRGKTMKKYDVFPAI